MDGPCQPWCTAADTACADAEGAAAAIAVASDLLWRWSARQWGGVCTTTARPCPAPTACGDRFGGTWLCGCSGRSATVELPGPIVAVDEVTIGGVVLDPGAYEVRDGRWLVRLDGERWPGCDDDWSVTWQHGAAPPPSGVRAAADLTCWLTRPENAACDLDELVRTLQRQNISFEVNPGDDANPTAGLPRTVREFLRAVNPDRMVARPRVWSPDRPGPRVRTIV